MRVEHVVVLIVSDLGSFILSSCFYRSCKTRARNPQPVTPETNCLL